MEKENIKKILNDAAADRNRQLSRWRYHIVKHPEEYDKYIELKEKLNNEKKELLQQMKEYLKNINKEKKLEYYKKYYEENKESIKKKAREYSREKYYPQHREQKILMAKAYQEKKKGELTEENIYFPKII
jgi:hypothetical protein